MKGLLRTLFTTLLTIILYRQFAVPLTPRLLNSDKQETSRTLHRVSTKQRANRVVRDPLITPSQCGQSWDSLDLSTIRSVDPFIWSVSGGEEYRKYANDILTRWEPMGLANVMVIALDQDTADHLCKGGYESILFDRPLNSYSKVVDAKLQVSRELAKAGISGLFIEMDIFCRSSPLSELMELESEKKHDIVILGHNNNHDYTNIGMYYVRASNRTAHFFDRLVDILTQSLHEKEYENEEGKIRKWFDQDIFNWCLQHSQFPQVKMGNETNPCKSVLVTTKFVSNLVISSNEPPVVTEQTVCIHPLLGSPFSSFYNKLSIAKSLGFDLTDVAADERLLKTKSGELTYFDNIRFGFHSPTWSEKELPKNRFLYHFSAMVTLAKESNRTLVLPKSLYTLDTKTLPLYSLVHLASVEKHVPWRWEVPDDLQDRSTIVISEFAKFDNVTESVNDSSSQITELDGLLYLKLGESSQVIKIMKSLKWCLDRSGRTFKYRGGRDWLCDDTLARRFVLPLEKA